MCLHWKTLPGFNQEIHLSSQSVLTFVLFFACQGEPGIPGQKVSSWFTWKLESAAQMLD